MTQQLTSNRSANFLLIQQLDAGVRETHFRSNQ
jgi:hypothetical protein